MKFIVNKYNFFHFGYGQIKTKKKIKLYDRRDGV